jgi:hypothetical protein
MPAPLWLVSILHGLTFVLHFVAMNVLVASAFHLAFASQPNVQRRMASAIPPAFSLTVSLGVAPLLFLQLVHGERFYASSIQMGWAWLGILGVLMLAYYAAYAVDGRFRMRRAVPGWLRLVPFVGLLVFSFVLAANVSLSERPDVMAALGAPGWNLAIAETNVIWRWSHELFGAIALGSLWLMWIGVRQQDDDPEAGQVFVRRGAMTAMIATAVGVGFGVVQLVVAPSDIKGALGGASLGIGILAGLGAVGMAGAAMKKPTLRKVHIALGLAVLTVAAKTLVRFVVRDNRLAAAGGVEPPPTDTQVGPIVLFVVCLLVAVAALGWLIRVMASAKPPEDAS